MNLKPEFELFIDIARQQAEKHESRRKADMRLFLFAIEIGQKKKLTPEERHQYEKTFLPAQLLCGVAHGDTPPTSFDRVAAGCIVDWLESEPKVRAWLERVLGHSLDEVYRPEGMSPEGRQVVIEGLSMLYGEKLSKEEAASLLERLEHPLDRA
jgi:hypothetical protein